MIPVGYAGSPPYGLSGQTKQYCRLVDADFAFQSYSRKVAQRDSQLRNIGFYLDGRLLQLVNSTVVLSFRPFRYLYIRSVAFVVCCVRTFVWYV